MICSFGILGAFPNAADRPLWSLANNTAVLVNTMKVDEVGENLLK
jgi:hypothetical protein